MTSSGVLGPADRFELWQQQLADVAGDITALDSEDLYKELERGIVGNPPALSGATLLQATPLVQTVHVLFRQYARVNERVSKAAAANASVPRWIPGHPVTAQVEEALSVPIDLAADEVLPGQTATLRRARTSPVGVPPGMLLAALPPAIAAARTTWRRFGPRSVPIWAAREPFWRR